MKVVLILADGMRPDALLQVKGAKELLAAEEEWEGKSFV